MAYWASIVLAVFVVFGGGGQSDFNTVCDVRCVKILSCFC